jgi:cob(I)alamin adenosyltransferase
MKIYTKTGDRGQTSLLGGTRVSKSDPRIEAYGTVDELNAVMGLLALHVPAEVVDFLHKLQSELFNLGSNLAREKKDLPFQVPGLTPSIIAELEQAMDVMTAELPPLRSFILPGGSPGSAHAHLARTVCRRAERRCIEVPEVMDAIPGGVEFLNRLSDYFFVLARFLSHRAGAAEIPWKPNS